jgi:hypothetical protein
MAIIPFINSSFFCCCFPFAVFEHSRVRDFKFLNLFSLSSKFFSRGQTRQRLTQHARQRARDSKIESTLLERGESRPRFLFARARVRSHTRAHTFTATGARVFQKKKDLCFRFKTLSLPGEKKFEKRCPRVRPDETRPRPIRRNKSWSN